MIGNLSSRFREKFNQSPRVISSAPGRFNLIGEHTDYNKGYVFPVAINLRIYFLVSPRKDEKVRVWAEDYQEEVTFSLQGLSSQKNRGWVKYIQGIYWVLRKEGYNIPGINALVRGNVPVEAGLSSSAALEVSIIYGLNKLFDLRISPQNMALYAQRAENEYVGVGCGVMDQFISVFGEEDKALFLDCETLEKQLIPVRLKENRLQILVYNSRVKRGLASSEYNKRREESGKALEMLKEAGIESYKEEKLDVLKREKNRLGNTLYKRAYHVMSENQRVKKALKAIKKNDFTSLGELIFQSHQSLRDNYEVSCPELDLLYEVGQRFAGCLGARLTGAGFGGSGIALIQRERIKELESKLFQEAQKRNFPSPKFYEVEIAPGATVHKN